MSSTRTVVLAIALITVAAGSFVAWSWWRRHSPRVRGGSEYERAVAPSEQPLSAERELLARRRRKTALKFGALPPQTRAAYVARWQEFHTHFSDASPEAVNEADDLVTQLITELGYPLDANSKRVTRLSMDQLNTLDSYREAHRISLSNRRGEATTEQLRLAVVRFHALVTDVLAEPDPIVLRQA
jgi:hypothetical protein